MLNKLWKNFKHSNVVNKFRWSLGILNDLYIIYRSPLKMPKMVFGFSWDYPHHGTPYFTPTFKTIDKDGKPYYKPKMFAFDVWSLGWKTKWTENDFRFEFPPGISIMFFRKQFVVGWSTKYMVSSVGDDESCPDQYWESFLNWKHNTDKDKSFNIRLIQLVDRHKNIWLKGKDNIKIDYYDYILKKKEYIEIKDIINKSSKALTYNDCDC